MLRPMVDPARPPAAPAEPASGPETVLVGSAEPSPVAESTPQPAALPEAFALPSARKVVSSGLQLALTSTSELRRASIYIGLLVLGAFGPAIIALLLIVGHLGDLAGEILGAMLLNEAFAPPTQAALEAALLVVAIEALIGLALFLTISIDAQVMAIAILGGRASDRPLRLWEAITRARQTFWRMAGAGTLIGIASAIVQLLLLGALGGLSQSAETANVVSSLIATILVAPLAYVATSIVIGDVGAMEALSRSWRLFRVRKGLAVVVVLFTFVTSAIQLFALSGGLDLVFRAAEVLHVSVTEGALAFATAVVLILAAVVAYGSLTFTISAIVSAPQVAGFLGLTFYSAGLDKARLDAAKPPPGFRYVSRPMAIAMVALGGIVALQIPAINAIPPVPSSGLVEQLRQQAAVESEDIGVRGYPDLVDDPVGDLTGSGPADIDIVRAEGTYLVFAPPWVLAPFACDDPAVACGTERDVTGFEEGAYTFLVRVGGPLVADPSRTVTILVSLPDEVTAFRRDGEEPYGGASRIYVTQPGAPAMVTSSRSAGDHFTPVTTAARARWAGTDVVMLIPIGELPGGPMAWDVVTLLTDPDGAVASRDTLRPEWDDYLPSWTYSSILIEDFRHLE